MASQHEGLRHSTVQTADGVVLPVVQAGAPGAPAVVLVHGVASSWHSWEALLRDERLVGRFRLVAFDLRGHGEHAAPLTAAQWGSHPGPTGDLWSQDLDAVLEAVGARDGAHLVGLSFGSTVVQAWMRRHGGLGSAASATLVAGPSVLGAASLEAVVTDLVTGEAFTALVGAASGGESAYAQVVLSRGQDDRSIDEGTRAVVEQTARWANPEAVAAALMYSFDNRTFLRALPAEELARVNALVCEQDQVFGASAMQGVWAQAGVRTHLLGGQPHGLPLVDPDRLCEELLTLLDPLDPRSPATAQ